MIQLQALHKTFGKKHVLKGVNATLEGGMCVALVGHNGCGKTTLIKCILGMVLPTGGDILLYGSSVLKEVHYRKHIGYMPQIGHYPGNMTIRQIIEIVKKTRPTPQSHLDEELIEKFELERIYDDRAYTLSGGTVQKVSACIAFLFSPNVVILDEPTAGLDLMSSEILKAKIIQEKEKGKLILVTSHVVNEFDGMLTHAMLMEEGVVRFQKSVEELLHLTSEEKISKAIAKLLTQEGDA